MGLAVGTGVSVSVKVEVAANVAVGTGVLEATGIGEFCVIGVNVTASAGIVLKDEFTIVGLQALNNKPARTNNGKKHFVFIKPQIIWGCNTLSRIMGNDHHLICFSQAVK